MPFAGSSPRHKPTAHADLGSLGSSGAQPCMLERPLLATCLGMQPRERQLGHGATPRLRERLQFARPAHDLERMPPLPQPIWPSTYSHHIHLPGTESAEPTHAKWACLPLQALPG